MTRIDVTTTIVNSSLEQKLGLYPKKGEPKLGLVGLCGSEARLGCDST